MSDDANKLRAQNWARGAGAARNVRGTLLDELKAELETQTAICANLDDQIQKLTQASGAAYIKLLDYQRAIAALEPADLPEGDAGWTPLTETVSFVDVAPEGDLLIELWSPSTRSRPYALASSIDWTMGRWRDEKWTHYRVLRAHQPSADDGADEDPDTPRSAAGGQQDDSQPEAPAQPETLQIFSPRLEQANDAMAQSQDDLDAPDAEPKLKAATLEDA